MKKILLLTIASLVLAVVLTAGCIGEQPQIYASSDDMFVFYSNGTGTYSAGTDDESFDWSEENSTRMILFADGDVLTVDINKVRGLMTTSEGTEYELKPNAVSGTMMDVVHIEEVKVKEDVTEPMCLGAPVVMMSDVAEMEGDGSAMLFVGAKQAEPELIKVN